MKQPILSNDAPQPIGPYSQAVRENQLLFVSGQIALPPSGGALPEGIELQTTQVLDNLEAILKAADLSWKHVVRVEILLADLADFQTVNALYAGRIGPQPHPARQAFQVACLPMDALIEVSCIAALPERNAQ